MSDYVNWVTNLEVGSIAKLRGNVTTLNWLMPGVNERTEENIGYRAGRLDNGYMIALLVQELTPDDFEFHGTTLRSGGKYGLPGANAKADAARTSVHDGILAERGDQGYVDLQNWALNSVPLTGAKRIAKVLPYSPTMKHLPPRDEYPMGGGGLQWNLTRDCDFLLALSVDADGNASAPDFSTTLEGASWQSGYDARARIRTYLETAKA